MVVDGSTFERHTSLSIPCDHMCQTTRASRGTLGRSHTVHRFRLLTSVASGLNQDLRAWALQQEQNAEGVAKTNVGGFQSAPDIFDDASSQPAVRTLHGIVSAAMEELDLASQYPNEARRPAPGCRTHAADAWVNVNRPPGDFNTLHVHAPDRWSGAYFVSAGAYTTARRLDGSLVFRGAAKRPSTDEDRDAEQAHMPVDEEDGEASHSYVALRPIPGDLILFPGAIPHLVLAQLVVDDGGTANRRDIAEADGVARISVAVNFVDAVPPPPT